MAVMKNAKEQFYVFLDEHIDEGLIEPLDNVDLESNNSSFYELCKKYADIGLNAPKSLDKQTMEVYGSIQTNDLELAYEATKEFIEKNEIDDLEKMFNLIEHMHKYAVEWDDKRVATDLQWQDTNEISAFRLGKFFNFANLPDNIFEEIEEAVRTGEKAWL